MPASKTRSTSFSLFIPLEAKTVQTYQKQKDRLEYLMGTDLARFFVWVDPSPQLPNAEKLNPVHEAKELHAFMLRNQVPLGEMREWILVSETEQRVIERCCRGDLSLLSFGNNMVDFRRQVWGAFQVLLEKKEQSNARKKLYDDGFGRADHSAVCSGGTPA
jgi:hypothetical protein